MKPIRAAVTAALVTASASKREVSGVLVPFGVRGSTSAGPTEFEPGSLTVHAERRRVKLLVQHDDERPVGYLSDVALSDAQATGTFHVPAGAAGDVALAEAANGLRDAFSVGVEITEYAWHDDGTLIVKAANLREVSLVSIPAYDDARVQDVAASRPTTKGTTMPCSICGQVHAAGAPPCTTPPAPPVQADAAATPPAPAPPAPPAPAAAPEPPAVVAAANAPLAPAPATGAGRGLDLRAAMRVAREVIRTGETARLSAALGDIVPSDDAAAGGIARPQWVGELWEASDFPRPVIDAIQHAPLTGLKVQGYRRAFTNLIDEYAGDKAAIHGAGTFATTPAEAEAQRWAGGNDIDRAFIDLGSEQFLQDWFRAAVDEYRLASEAYVLTEMLAAATAVAGAESVTQALALIGAAAAGHASNLSFVTFSAAAWQTFVNLPASEVPWWLQRQGEVNLGTVSGNAGGISFSVNPALTGNQVLAGDRRSATFYEVDPPIRVQALNIPNGGVDVGVFGYGALLVNDPGSLFKATIVPPAPAPEA